MSNHTPLHKPVGGLLARRLRSPVQRGLFLFGCFGLVPWFLFRVIRELWQSAGVRDYLRYVFLEPIKPWIESGWWWFMASEWYDWSFLPSLILIAVSFLWPYTGSKLVKWVRGQI